MATVRKNKSGNWEAMIRRKGIPTVTKTFPTKRQADAFAADMESKIAKGKSIASPNDFTVGEALEEYANYISEPVLDENGKPMFGEDGKAITKIDPRKRSYLNGLLPEFGEFSVGFLTFKRVEKFVVLMRTKPIPRPEKAVKTHPLYNGATEKFYAESTIRKFVYMLKSALDFHARAHNYTYNEHLFSEEKPKGWTNKRKRRVQAGEKESILEACRSIITRDECGTIVKKRDRKHGQTYAALVVFLLETGARLQEALLADWTEFDVENRVWSIPVEHVKTKEDRQVPLSLKALGVLKSMREISGTNEKIFGHLPKGKTIFVTWKRICKDAQIDDLGFHDFRHECICQWVIKGAGDTFISKAAGHDISVMQHYAYLRGKELMLIVDA